MKRNNSELNKLYRPVIHFSNQSIKNNITGNWRYLAPVAGNKTSPCEASCPLALPIPSLIMEIGKGRMDHAAGIISHETPLPSVCGRVCPHPCETGCSRGSFDEAIAIHALERMAGDRLFKKPAGIPKPAERKRIAVIGGGPAGLSAAYFLLLLGHKVTIFEAKKKLGGILRYGIPEYRLPEKVLDSSLRLIMSLKPDIKTGMVLGKNISPGDLKNYDATFIGTGAGAGIPFSGDAELSGLVKAGTGVLEGLKSGKAEKTGQRVIIIGGGNSAIDTARSLLRLGKKPMVLYRREIGDMPAFRGEVERAIEEGVEIITASIIKGIEKKGSRITAVRCIKVKQGKAGKNRKAELTEIKGTGFTIKADDIISATGEVPDFSWDTGGIKHDRGGIFTDEYGRTGATGIFAGGDMARQTRQVVHAMASGKRSAISMDAIFSSHDLAEVYGTITLAGNGQSFMKYLDFKNGATTAGEDGQPWKPPKINLDYFELMERQKEKKLDAAESRRSFAEINRGLDMKSAVRETERCFQCGKCIQCKNCVVFCPDLSVRLKNSSGIEINYDYCKGCGICAEECPRGVIGLIKEVHR